MVKYALRRLALMVPTALIVLFITFLLGSMGPLDPVKVLVQRQLDQGLQPTNEQIAQLRHEYGLDRPFLAQFLEYVGDILRGDLGFSYFGGAPVRWLISQSFPVSGQLALAAGVVLVFVGIPLGVLAALRHNTWLDYLIVGGTLFLRAIPIYVLAPIVLIILVSKLQVMDVPRGFPGLFHPFSIVFVGLLILDPLAVVIRQTRAGMLEVLGNDYVRTARAKGLPSRTIIVRHVLRIALIPVITSLGLILSGLVTGMVFLDLMFNIPGFGRLFGQALSQRDFPVIFGVVIITSFLTMGANLLVDLMYPLLDPRVKYA